LIGKLKKISLRSVDSRDADGLVLMNP
jgi:hypothetical protein